MSQLPIERGLLLLRAPAELDWDWIKRRAAKSLAESGAERGQTMIGEPVCIKSGEPDDDGYQLYEATADFVIIAST